jgi:hypothetical protein
METVKSRRTPKGNENERSLLLSAMTTYLREQDPEVESKARQTIPLKVELTPVMLAVTHQTSCRNNVPNATNPCHACAAANGIWTHLTGLSPDRFSDDDPAENRQTAVAKPGHPRDTTTNAVDAMIRQWGLSHAEVASITGSRRERVKARAKRNLAIWRRNIPK